MYGLGAEHEPNIPNPMGPDCLPATEKDILSCMEMLR